MSSLGGEGENERKEFEGIEENEVFRWLTGEVRIKPNVAMSYVKHFAEHGFADLEALTCKIVSLEDLERFGIKKFHRAPIYRSLQAKHAVNEEKTPCAEEKPSVQLEEETGLVADGRVTTSKGSRFNSADIAQDSIFQSFVPKMFLSMDEQKVLVEKERDAARLEAQKAYEERKGTLTGLEGLCVNEFIKPDSKPTCEEQGEMTIKAGSTCMVGIRVCSRGSLYFEFSVLEEGRDIGFRVLVSEVGKGGEKAEEREVSWEGMKARLKDTEKYAGRYGKHHVVRGNWFNKSDCECRASLKFENSYSRIYSKTVRFIVSVYADPPEAAADDLRGGITIDHIELFQRIEQLETEAVELIQQIASIQAEIAAENFENAHLLMTTKEEMERKKKELRQLKEIQHQQADAEKGKEGNAEEEKEEKEKEDDKDEQQEGPKMPTIEISSEQPLEGDSGTTGPATPVEDKEKYLF